MSNVSDFVIENDVLKKYVGPGGDVVVPEGVTIIGTGAFLRCHLLTGVVLPQTLTVIDRDAFSDCAGLRKITLPPKLNVVRYGAFSGCSSLESIELPEGLSSIGDLAFKNCRGLTKVEFPETLTYIGEEAFWGCCALTDITLPEKVNRIRSKTFSGCSGLHHVSLPQTVPAIEEEAFRGCSGLADDNGFTIVNGILFGYFGCGGNVVIPEGVRVIDRDAFNGCKGITGIIIPESVLEIRDGAFQNCCEIEQIVVPNSVISMGSAVFQSCSSLRSVSLSNNLPDVEEDVFKGCEELTYIRFPDSYYCGGIDMLPSIIQLPALAGFSESVLEGREFSPDILKYYETEIRRKKKSLYPYAVNCIYLLRYLIERKLIPENHIDECMGLAEKGNSPEAKAALIEYSNREFGGKDPFSDGKSLSARLPKPVDKTSPTYLRKIWPRRNTYERTTNDVFEVFNEDCFISRYLGEDTDVAFPSELDGVKLLGVSYRAGAAPAGYKEITSLHFPDGYRFFGAAAFEGCTKLKEVFLPLTTDRVCDQLFMNCVSLERAVLPFSWLAAKWLFRDCTSLKDVYILSDQMRFGNSAPFRGCNHYTVHAPADSNIAKELQGKHFVPLTNADTEMLAKQYYAVPIRRHVFFNRSNMGTRTTIRTGEPIAVVNGPDMSGVRRENGSIYEIESSTYQNLFAEYINGVIVSEVYKDKYNRNCFDVDLTLKEEYR